MSTPESRRTPANPRFVTKSIFLPISEQRGMFTPLRLRSSQPDTPPRRAPVRDLPLHDIRSLNAGSAMWIASAPSSTFPAAIAHGTVQVTKSLGFIAKHGLWTDEQRRQAEDIKRRIETDNLHLVRLAWADPHGASRAKAVTAPGFAAALTSGHNINVATSTLDSANARIFDSFTRGGGMGLEEMTGSPNLTIVPDPATFRVLPWAPGVGWVLCDEYFNNGVPFHFSPRQLLRKQLKRLAEQGMSSLVGLEIDGERIRSGAGGVHVHPAAGTRSGRSCAAVPHGDPPALPPDGLSRHVHVPAGTQRLLFQRLASPPVSGERQGRSQSVHAGAGAGISVSPGPRFSRRLDETCRRLHAVCDPHGQWLPTISAELACAGSGHLVSRSSRRDDPRAGRPRGSGHPDGEPDRRACREPLPLYPLADRGRARRHREQA